jgi:histidine phosphotransferase ChpT
MTHTTLSLATLVGSRICHDLISPVGAINNGIELIAMGGPINTPELSLISDSVTNASSRIKFFRIAFGVASPEQVLGGPTVVGIVQDAYSASRHRAEWQANGDVSRAEVQSAFLAILCIESALPRGGVITVTRERDSLCVSGSGDRVICDAALWNTLGGASLPGDLRPADVQFALLPLVLSTLGRAPTIVTGDSSVSITY